MPERFRSDQRHGQVYGRLALPPLRLVFISIALAEVGYPGLSLWAGWREATAAVTGVGFFVTLGVLALSLVNYLFRFLRWARYLHLADACLP